MLTKVFIALYLSLPSLWAFPSLFFTKEEIDLIHSVQKKTTKSIGSLHLLAIIYVNKDHWSLWVNHRIIHPHHPLNIEGFQIEQVTPHTVTFFYRPSKTSAPLKVILRPNQTFFVNEKRVVFR